jgi:hypothetical protein
MDHFDEMHLLDEVNHLIQTGIDMSPVIAHGTDSNLCPLPQIIITNL